MTRRQQEFLEAVVDLGAGQRGVHYTEVAERLGVSKWTAYDILNTMTRQGYLSVEREERGSELGVGRTRVLFWLTPQGMKAAERRPFEGEEVWESAKRKLHAFVDDSRAKGTGEILYEVIKELGNIYNPLVFCAYLIVVALLGYRVIFQGSAQDSLLASYLLSLLAAPQAAVVAFVGSLVALILSSSKQQEVSCNWMHYLRQYEAEVRNLDPQTQHVLSDFAIEMANKLWPGLTGREDRLALEEE